MLRAVAFSALWRPGRFSDVQTARPSIVAKGRADVLGEFSMIERILGDHHR